MSVTEIRPGSSTAQKALAVLKGEKEPDKRPPLAPWAPKNLLHLYQTHPNNHKQDGVLFLLCTRPDMEQVWACLNRRSNTFEERAYKLGTPSYHSLSFSLFLECENAMLDWKYRPKLTRSQARRIHKKITSAALDLAGDLVLVRDGRYEEAIRDAMGDADVDDFWARVEDVFRRGDDGIEYLGPLGPTSEFHLIRNSPINRDQLAYALAEVLPPVSSILLRLSEIASHLAQHAEGLEQPNSPMAGPRYVARRLSRYFKRHYDLPLHEQVATLVGALFNCQMDRDQVRGLVSSKRRRGGEK